jgi:hypothetical protein
MKGRQHAIFASSGVGWWRFYNVVDLVNRLNIETRNGRQGRLAEHLTRMDLIVLDEFGYLPFAQSGGERRLTLGAYFSFGPLIAVCCQAYISELANGKGSARAVRAGQGCGDGAGAAERGLLTRHWIAKAG